jgi:hypothetical protein
LLDSQDNQDCKEREDLLVGWDLLDRLDLLGVQDNKDLWELRVQLENKACLGTKDQ